MLMQLIPPINKVFSLLIQQEQQQSTPLDEDKLVANIKKHCTKGRPTGYGLRNFVARTGRGFKIYTFYNKPDHAIKVCLKKHGLPHI